MNAAELKLDLFRKIDNLSTDELKMNYDKILNIINNTSKYHLSATEKKAIENALEESEKGKLHTQSEVVAEAKQKYPNLKFE